VRPSCRRWGASLPSDETKIACTILAILSHRSRWATSGRWPFVRSNGSVTLAPHWLDVESRICSASDQILQSRRTATLSPNLSALRSCPCRVDLYSVLTSEIRRATNTREICNCATPFEFRRSCDAASWLSACPGKGGGRGGRHSLQPNFPASSRGERNHRSPEAAAGRVPHGQGESGLHRGRVSARVPRGHAELKAVPHAAR
jgi:hypothetical protein